MHLFGLAADMEKILAISKKFSLWVVEDAACGFGAKYHNNHVGTFGDAGCFSFHPRKAITTGEGGMITTNDASLAEKLRRLRDHGASMTDLQRHQGARPYLLSDHPDAGYNQRLTDIQAALGVAQMSRAQSILSERKRLAENYDIAFASLNWLRTPAKITGYVHGYQSYPCFFQPNSINKIEEINRIRNEFMEKLQNLGISTRPATHAVHMLTYYSKKYKLKSSDFPGAWSANDCSISLPLYHGMSDIEQNYVIEKVVENSF